MKRRTRQFIGRLAVFSVVASVVAAGYGWLCVVTFRPLPEDPTFLALQLRQEPPPKTRLMDPKTGELSRQYFVDHDKRLYKVTIAFRDNCYGEIEIGRTDANGKPVITSATECHPDGTRVRYEYDTKGRNIVSYIYVGSDGTPVTRTTPLSAARRRVVWLGTDGTTPIAEATVGNEMTIELKLLHAGGRALRAEFKGTKNLDTVQLQVRDASGNLTLTEHSHPRQPGIMQTDVVVYAAGSPRLKQVWLQEAGKNAAEAHLRSAEQYFADGHTVKTRVEALPQGKDGKKDGPLRYRVEVLDENGRVLKDIIASDLAATGVEPVVFAEPTDSAEQDVSARLNECFNSKKQHDHITSFLAP